nr:retrovirus-related Pol polyprotein from transposon TNT 1-94 [Tanacetum cinerariifolium]
MRMMGELTYFLRLQIKQDDKGTVIYQEQYTRNLLKKYEIFDSSLVKTPMVPPNKLGPDLAGKPVNETSYRGMIGSLIIVIAYDPFLSDDETKQRPFREFLIKFSVLNRQRPLTLDFKTFSSSTGLDYNNSKYVAHPTPVAVKKELGKISINMSYLDKTLFLKNSFPVAWRILFTFVIQVLGENYSSTEQVNPIKQLLAYCLISGTEGLEVPGALFKKSKRPKSKKPPTKTKVTSPKPMEGFEQSHSVSIGTVPDPQDLERDIQLVSTRLPSILVEGTRKTQPLPEGKATHPKDLRGNIQPLDRDLTSTTPDEGMTKTMLHPERLLRDKDSGGNIPPADMKLIHTIVADPSGTGAKYQVDETQSTRLRYQSLTKNEGKTSFEDELDKDSDEEEVLATGEDMDEDLRVAEEAALKREVSSLSSQAGLRIDKGKGIVTESEKDPSKKLVHASNIVYPNPDEPVKVEFMINGKMVYLTKQEIQEYRDKEYKMKKATKEAKLLAMSKPEVIKVVWEEAKKLGINPKEAIFTKAGEQFKKAQDAEHEVLKREHSKKVKRLTKLNKRRAKEYMITELDELGPIIQKKKNSIVKDPMTSLSKRYKRLKKIPKELGIQSALPAPVPEQALSQTSGRKRKHTKLEPKIKVPGLECNRSLLEGVPLVNNMVIEEPEYRIFFTDVFGDQAFQIWNDIHKVRVDSLVSDLVMASIVKTKENSIFSLKLRKLIADHPDQEKLKSKKVKLKALEYHVE